MHHKSSSNRLFQILRDEEEPRRVLLIIAHPDDEAMFFSPIIIYAITLHWDISILCLSTGNFYGHGHIRSRELVDCVTQVYGISQEKLFILDRPEMQDGMKNIWPPHIVGSAIFEHCSQHPANLILTFDEHGVSGHANHRAAYVGTLYALSKLLRDSSCPHNVVQGGPHDEKGSSMVVGRHRYQLHARIDYLGYKKRFYIDDGGIDENISSLSHGIRRHGHSADGCIRNDTFCLDEHIFHGGHGDIFRAHRINKDGIVEDPGVSFVLKRMNAFERPHIERCALREIYFGRLLRQFPSVARFEDFFKNGTDYWLVFRDEGLSLQQLLYSISAVEGGDSVTLRPSRVWRRFRTTVEGQASIRRVIYQVVAGLSNLHAIGIIHRDVKLSNVLLNTEHQPKLLVADFSSALNEDAVRGEMFGFEGPTTDELTTEYAPPEVRLGQSRFFSFDLDHPFSYDTWCVGVLFLEIVLGTAHVFEPDQRTAAIISQRLSRHTRRDNYESLYQRALLLSAYSEFCIYDSAAVEASHESSGISPSGGSNRRRTDQRKSSTVTSLEKDGGTLIPSRESDWQELLRAILTVEKRAPPHFTIVPSNPSTSTQSCDPIDSLRRAILRRDILGLGFNDRWGLDLMSRLLRWRPEDRISMNETLLHAYFVGPYRSSKDGSSHATWSDLREHDKRIAQTTFKEEDEVRTAEESRGIPIDPDVDSPMSLPVGLTLVTSGSDTEAVAVFDHFGGLDGGSDDISDSEAAVSLLPDAVEALGLEFTCEKCGRVFADWSACHRHVTSRKHIVRPNGTTTGATSSSSPSHFRSSFSSCMYDASRLPQCLSEHALLPMDTDSGWCELQGRRRNIEDVHAVVFDASHRLFGVFDGHFGSRAARYTAKNFHRYFKETMTLSSTVLCTSSTCGGYGSSCEDSGGIDIEEKTSIHSNGSVDGLTTRRSSSDCEMISPVDVPLVTSTELSLSRSLSKDYRLTAAAEGDCNSDFVCGEDTDALNDAMLLDVVNADVDWRAVLQVAEADELIEIPLSSPEVYPLSSTGASAPASVAASTRHVDDEIRGGGGNGVDSRSRLLLTDGSSTSTPERSYQQTQLDAVAGGTNIDATKPRCSHCPNYEAEVVTVSVKHMRAAMLAAYTRIERDLVNPKPATSIMGRDLSTHTASTLSTSEQTAIIIALEQREVRNPDDSDALTTEEEGKRDLAVRREAKQWKHEPFERCSPDFIWVNSTRSVAPLKMTIPSSVEDFESRKQGRTAAGSSSGVTREVSGTTATVIILFERFILVGNVGDSRAVLCCGQKKFLPRIHREERKEEETSSSPTPRKNTEDEEDVPLSSSSVAAAAALVYLPIQLTKDHTPYDEAEAVGVQERGGWISGLGSGPGSRQSESGRTSRSSIEQEPNSRQRHTSSRAKFGKIMETAECRVGKKAAKDSSQGVRRVNGILAVSRSLGDAPLKPVVSSAPDVLLLRRPRQRRYGDSADDTNSTKSEKKRVRENSAVENAKYDLEMRSGDPLGVGGFSPGKNNNASSYQHNDTTIPQSLYFCQEYHTRVNARSRTRHLRLDNELYSQLFIIIASDGLWDVMTNFEATELVCRALLSMMMIAEEGVGVYSDVDTSKNVPEDEEHKNLPEENEDEDDNGTLRYKSSRSLHLLLPTNAFHEAAKSLAREALVRGSSDNIGVCVVNLV